MLVLDPSSEFFKYFRGSGGGAGTGAAAPKK
jgi:hypothetical protein